MGLLAVIRELRRRVAGTRTATLVHCSGLPDAELPITRDNIDEVLGAQIASGRIGVIARQRLCLFGRWWHCRFNRPWTDSGGG